MKSYFRLLFAFIALGLLAASVVGVVYVWENLVAPKRALQAEIEEIRSRKRDKVDYGEKVFQSAVAQLRAADLGAAVGNLHKLMIYHRDSGFYSDAKRIVGEINVDRLLSKQPMPGKTEYIVQSGDVLGRIANKTNSTVGYIISVNGMMGSALQKGDQLVVCSLEFGIVVNLAEQTLTVRTAEDKFFKEYRLVDYKTPPGTPSSFDTKVSAMIVGSGSRLVPVGKSEYNAAPKELRCERQGVALRAKGGDPESDQYTSGIFIDPEDLEELVLFIRPGTKVLVRK